LAAVKIFCCGRSNARENIVSGKTREYSKGKILSVERSSAGRNGSEGRVRVHKASN
jgi:hypothetical protein